jgi:DNA-binding response OmpR family regulator
VIGEASLPDGTWRDLLRECASFPAPPRLIVTSNLTDDRLWADALNLGAYDVLAKPFRAAEVFRIISLAWRQWKDSFGKVPAKYDNRRVMTAAAS